MVEQSVLRSHADEAQLVEHNLAKVGVASSSLVVRSISHALVAQLDRAAVSGTASAGGSNPFECAIRDHAGVVQW